MADSLSSQGVLGAAQESVLLSVAGLGGVAFQVQGTFSGTITFEATVQGQDFTAFRVTAANSSTPVTTATTAGIYIGSAVGFLSVRARMSAYTSGSATVLVRADVASPGSSSSGGGGGGGTSSDFDAAFPAEGTAAGFLGSTGNMEPVELEADGSLPVTIVAGAGSGGTSSAFGAAFPADGTAMGVADPDGNMRPLSAETLDYDSGAGTVAQTIIGIALPGSGGPVAGGTTTNPIQVGDAGGSITVDGSVTANAGTNLNTSALALEATLSSLNGKVTAVNTGAVTISAALPAGTNAIGKLAANSGVDIGDVDVTSLPALPAGNNNIGDVDVATIPGIVGTVADDATTPGAPVMVGGFAKSPDGTDPGSVSAENDVARAITDLNRRVYVNTEHPRSGHKHLDGTSAYTDESIVSDPGDGFQTIITNIIASNGEAIALNFFLEEGSTKIFGPIYLPAVAGSGFCSGPIRLPVTASTAVTLTSSAANDQAYDIDYYIQAV